MRSMHLLAGMVLLLAACGGKPDQEERASGGDRGMAGMRMDSTHAGMGMDGMKMMPVMRAHMDSMMAMSTEQMSRAMAGHDRMMSQMMDQMGGEMRQMNMAPTPEWNALTDSVKGDLAELPALEGQDLSTRMRAHADRVKRLIASHEQMMKSMQ